LLEDIGDSCYLDDWNYYLFCRAEDKGRNNLSFVMLLLMIPLVVVLLWLSLGILDIGLFFVLLSPSGSLDSAKISYDMDDDDSAFGAFAFVET